MHFEAKRKQKFFLRVSGGAEVQIRMGGYAVNVEIGFFCCVVGYRKPIYSGSISSKFSISDLFE